VLGDATELLLVTWSFGSRRAARFAVVDVTHHGDDGRPELALRGVGVLVVDELASTERTST